MSDERAMIDSETVTAGAIRQSIAAAGVGLREVARMCHELTVRRDKYPFEWTPNTGRHQINVEAAGWWQSACMVDFGDEEFREKWRESEAMELGELLATVLSVGHHRGIDVEAALLGAIKRNRIDEARTRAKQELRVQEGDRRV